MTLWKLFTLAPGYELKSKFQSLFFWMTLWKASLSGIWTLISCFNPCFSGWRSESEGLVSHRDHVVLFQSLFFWMTLWKRSNCETEQCQHPVSILVFLDDALKVPSTSRFSRRHGVSILVFLDDALKEWSHLWLGGYVVGFQSLFFWMTLWKSTARECPGPRNWVSILVFLDDALKGGIPTRWSHGWEFQSLFFWMTLWKALIRDDETGELMFQSLFFWMTLWKAPCSSSLTMEMSSFNPCFSGWRSERGGNNGG